jgi:hypothetical protein
MINPQLEVIIELDLENKAQINALSSLAGER